MIVNQVVIMLGVFLLDLLTQFDQTSHSSIFRHQLLLSGFLSKWWNMCRRYR